MLENPWSLRICVFRAAANSAEGAAIAAGVLTLKTLATEPLSLGPHAVPEPRRELPRSHHEFPRSHRVLPPLPDSEPLSNRFA